MDSKLEKALDFSNFRQTLYNQQQTLFSKVEDLKLLTYRDRLIKTSEELIAFCLLFTLAIINEMKSQ